MVAKSSGKASRRLEREKIKTSALVQSLDGLFDILKEFIRASNSNPVIGVTASFLMVSIMAKMKLLTVSEQTACMVAIGAIEGGQIASSVLNEMPWNAFKPAVNDSKPSASTIVYQDSHSDGSALEGARMGEK
jgi:hypothetical protein